MKKSIPSPAIRAGAVRQSTLRGHNEKEKKMEELENVDVEALTEGDLEEVAGGVCSVSGCSNHN